MCQARLRHPYHILSSQAGYEKGRRSQISRMSSRRHAQFIIKYIFVAIDESRFITELSPSFDELLIKYMGPPQLPSSRNNTWILTESVTSPKSKGDGIFNFGVERWKTER